MPKSNRAKKLAAAVSAWAARWVYLVYYKTLRVEMTNPEAAPQNLSSGPNQIYMFWHSKTFSLLPCCRNSNVAILTLPDWRNLFYSALARTLGYKTIVMTSESKAAMELKKMIEDGFHAGLAVDGPKGPRGVLQPGALYLAGKTNRTVCVISVTAEKAFRLKGRWDRFEIPYPFSKVRIRFNSPLKVADKDLIETETKILRELGDC